MIEERLEIEPPTTRYAREHPHEHRCPKHGKWFHVEPGCPYLLELECPDDMGTGVSITKGRYE